MKCFNEVSQVVIISKNKISFSKYNSSRSQCNQLLRSTLDVAFLDGKYICSSIENIWSEMSPINLGNFEQEPIHCVIGTKFIFQCFFRSTEVAIDII